MKITSFKNENFFNSNFYPCEIYSEGVTFPTLEHAFQSAKTDNIYFKTQILLALTPGEARQIGKYLMPKKFLKENWDEIKYDVMLKLVTYKFTWHKDLREKLLATGDAQLIEGNFYHDNYWGVCSCECCVNIEGQNNLGKILMEVRRSLRKNNE